jgi:hypothetical protein
VLVHRLLIDWFGNLLHASLFAASVLNALR